MRSLLASAARRADSRAAASSGTMPPGDRLAARLGHQAASADRGRVAHLAGAERRGVWRHHLVAGGQHGHPRPGVHGHLGDPGRGQHAEILGAQRPARGDQFGAGSGVLVGPDHAVARRDRPDHLDRARHGLLGVLDHHDGVRAAGQHAAGGHAGHACRGRP